jgi:hypothetical protein
MYVCMYVCLFVCLLQMSSYHHCSVLHFLSWVRYNPDAFNLICFKGEIATKQVNETTGWDLTSLLGTALLGKLSPKSDSKKEIMTKLM